MNSCKRQSKSTKHADVTEIPKEEPKSGMTKDEFAQIKQSLTNAATTRKVYYITTYSITTKLLMVSFTR